MPVRPDVLCAGGCGQLLWRGSGSLDQPTCRSCRRAAKEARIPEHLPIGSLSTRTCSACGDVFTYTVGIGRIRRFCPECAPRTSFKRKAKRYSVDYEPINRRRVYDRDHWRCGICGGAVPKAATYPSPLSPSLDHVLPMSKGGPHTYGNVQLAHLRCNHAKHDRLGNPQGDQLRLVG